MWVVHRGELEVLKGLQRIKVLRERDFFGERVLLGVEPRYTASLRTLTMCHVIEVHGVAFMKALQNYPYERHLFERIKPSFKEKPEEASAPSVQSPQSSQKSKLTLPIVVSPPEAGNVTPVSQVPITLLGGLPP